MKKRFFLYLIALFFVFGVSGCGCGGGDEAPVPVLVSIEVSPADPSIPLGASQQFTATGVFSDHTTLDLTQAVTWSSSDTGIAAISNTEGSKGLAASAMVGSTTIIATSGSVSGKTTLTVTGAALVSIAIAPVNPSIALGTTQQFAATGTYSDASTRDITGEVIWNTGTPSVATIGNAEGSKGMASSHATGQTSVSAVSGVLSATTTLTVTAAQLVSLAVTPQNPAVVKGTAQQFRATGTFTDNSTQDLTTTATWSSSDASVAIVSNITGSQGLATTLSPGIITVTATYGGLSGSTLLTVKDVTLVSIAVTPASRVASFGVSVQYSAMGTYSDSTTKDITTLVTWSSSDTSTATISNAPATKGLATVGHTIGQTTITATLGSVSGSASLATVTLASITVTPVNRVEKFGASVQYTATAAYSDGSTEDITTIATWSSSDMSIATISNAPATKGLATTEFSIGQTTISATLGTLSGSTSLTVSLASITVTPANLVASFGISIQYTATGTYFDGSTEDITTLVTWSSSDTSIATISNAPGTKGLATTDHKIGYTIITATLGNVSGSTSLVDP